MNLGSILGELHRRSVWQVLGSYAVGAWIILQLAETLAGLIGLPLWFGPTVVTLILMGFPLVLLTSFLQGGRRSGEGGKEGPDGPGKAILRRTFTWRNAGITVAATVALLGVGTAGYTGMRAAGLGPFGSLIAKNILESDERLLLAEFADRTQDGTLGETVTALFRIDLSQSTSVRLLERGQLASALARMERDSEAVLTQDVALELAQREGIKGVVTGEVLPLGEGAVVSARLVTPSGETLVAEDASARDVADIPQAVDDLSARLRERIGESLRSIQGDAPLHEVTTSSLDALKRYAQADQANDQGEWERAVELLEEALRMDSTFAMAWRKLGVLHQNEDRDQERATQALTKAYEFRSRLSDRERYLAEAAYFTYVEEDRPRAQRAYEAVLESYPADRIALNNLAVAYGDMGDMDRALNLYMRSIRAGTAPAVTYTNAARNLFELGKIDSVNFVLAEFEEVYPSNPNVHRFASALAAAQFNYGAAEDHLQSMLEEQVGNPGWEMTALADLASIRLLQGRGQEARTLILQTYDLQDMLGGGFIPQPRGVFTAMIDAMIRIFLYRQPEEAVAILDEAWAERVTEDVDPTSLDHLQVGSIYAYVGRADRAREVLADYEEEVDSTARSAANRQWARDLLVGLIAGAEGRSEEALDQIQQARAEAAEDCPLCFLAELGDAYADVGRYQEAVDAYRQYLDTPVLFRLQVDNVNLHKVLLGLARSQRALGNSPEAREAYETLLELWSDPDPQVMSFADELRRELREL